MKDALYKYRAVVNYVYDGDTITCNIDLGLNCWVHNEKLRLARINAPELRGDERPAGLSSRDYLAEMISGKEIYIQTEKDKKGKFGRYIAEVWLETTPNLWLNINDHLVEQGFAKYQQY